MAEHDEYGCEPCDIWHAPGCGSSDWEFWFELSPEISDYIGGLT